MKRYLIVSQLNKKINLKGKIFYLGEWCRNEKNIHLETENIIDYHWDNRKKLFNDYKKLKNIKLKIISKIIKDLNKSLGLSFSNLYWKIILGPWFFHFADILYDRWFMLEKAINANKIDTIVLNYNYNNKIDPPRDFNHFNELLRDNLWNEYLYFQIIKICYPQIKFKFLFKSSPSKIFFSNTNIRKNEIRFKIINKLSSFINDINFLFFKKDDVFLISKQFSIIFLLSYFIKQRKIPRIWFPVSPIFNNNKKKNYFRKINSTYKKKSFQNILLNLSYNNLPMIYLENFKKNKNFVKKIKWPLEPKKILTTTSHINDETFKFWLAEKKEKSSKFYIMQHGGNYGTALFSSHWEHEKYISDYFITWGWKNKSNKNISFSPFHIIHKKSKNNFNKKKNGFLILNNFTNLSNYIYSVPQSISQMIKYNKFQKTFLSSLNIRILNSIKIKPYNNTKGMMPFPIKKINNHKLDFVDKNIFKIFNEAKICICTTNTTTFLESLYLNIPTVIVWDKNFFELNNSSKPYFKMLTKANIFFENPVKAAKFLNENWYDIEKWWNSIEVVKARTKFTNEYAKKFNHPYKRLKQILR